MKILHSSCKIHSIMSFLEEIVQALQENEVVNLWIGEQQGGFTIDWPSVLLTDEERSRAERFVQPLDRSCFVFRRKLLKAILTQYASSNIVEIPTNGQLISKKGTFYFSHSNKHRSLWYTFSTYCQVGVDLEKHDPNLDTNTVEDLFFEKTRSSCPRSISQFFQLWTQKEALAKCAQISLQQSLQTPTEVDHKNNTAHAHIANKEYYVYSYQSNCYYVSIAATKELKTIKTYEKILPK